jgi:hypothetical protein
LAGWLIVPDGLQFRPRRFGPRYRWFSMGLRFSPLSRCFGPLDHWSRPLDRWSRPQPWRFGPNGRPGSRLGTAAARPRRVQIHRLAVDLGYPAAERIKLHRPKIIRRAAPALRWPPAPEGSPEIAHAGLKSMDRLVDQVNSRVVVAAPDPED